MRQSAIKEQVLKALCSGAPVSGGALASRLGVSRTAVWKTVNALRAEGYFINGLAGGYILSPDNTRLCGEQLRDISGENIIFKETAVSTNEDVKALAAAGGKEFETVVARRQTGGKGRMGRSFISDEGGLYFSVLLRPAFSAETCLKITTAAAVAAAIAIEKVCMRKTSIKWVNDVFIGDKKVCGILTEGVFDAENGRISHAVLGVGINVYKKGGKFPEEIKDTAGCLFENEAPPSLAYCALLGEFLERFREYYADIEKMPHLDNYRRRAYLTGKTVIYRSGGKEHTATVTGVDDKARLIVCEKGKERYISSGEVEILRYEKHKD